MKYSKAVYVTLQDIKGNLNRGYDVRTKRIPSNERDYSEKNYEPTKDFSCQYDSNRDAVICTCKRTKREEYGYFNTSRQVYRSQRYLSARGFTDIGVGSVKTVPRKKVRRIYLPDTEDRGVGSSDLTSFIRRPRNGPNSYYVQKKTSSKCVGGVMECQNTPVVNERLSPICKTKFGCTSPRRESFEEGKNKDNHSIVKDPVVNLVIGRKHVARNKTIKEQGTTILQETPTYTTHADKKYEASLPNTSKIKPILIVNEEKDFSSDSLVQHVHNLENPSSFKHSKTSIAIIGNKLEREYIKMFSTIPKQDKPIAEVHPVRDCTSASLRKRFEALRRGFIKKDVSKEHGIVIKSSSHDSAASKKDVSITSDPPSLEARSYTNTKKYSPVPSHLYDKYEDVPQTSYRDSVTGKKRSSQWSTHAVDSDCQDVKGMFKLWGKKFNLEEDGYEKTSPYTAPGEPTKQKNKVKLVLPKEEVIETPKKEGKRFSFFKRKHKEKAKQPYKSKKGVTAGRCEVGDGLTIKIGAANEFTPEVTRIKSEQIPDSCDDILRKAWLKRCLETENDSRNSVKIRWNNEMYATSSSTVLELMECVYKNTGIVFTSKSEVTTTSAPTTTTVEDPYHPHKNPHVTFMQQSIQAWMIPKMIIDKTIDIQQSTKKKDLEVSFSNHKWFIDKSKAFSQKIELVLHSKNFVKEEAARSAEYIVIDIPKGYFLESSSDDEQSQSSDEQVYNIVEYETARSSSYLKKKRIDRKMDTGDHETDIRVTVNVKQNEEKETDVQETVIQTPLMHRDVVVQGSNVYVPKRCDVISVGIITQHTHNRDIKDIKMPGLKIQDVITDDESAHTMPPQKKCELAENYLQDYYRHCIPIGMDLYSWCISDSNLRASSDNNSLNSFNNQGDGTKSCPNIYDDYQASAVVSSCTNSSRSQGMVVDETTTYYNKLKKKSDPQQAGADGKRVLPKDSVEVFKRRKMYAANNVKADWYANQGSEPLCKPSIFDKFAQKSTCDAGNSKNKTKKHVSLKDVSKKIGESIMSFKGSVGSMCKKKESCMKHTRVVPEPKCEMLPAPCLATCTKKKKPPCSKQGSPTCLVPAPPICPAGSPSPCQPACPPKPPPCAPYLEGNLPSPSQSPPTLPPKSTNRSFCRFLSRRKCSPPASQQKSPSPSDSAPSSPSKLPPSSPPKSLPSTPPKSPTSTPPKSPTSTPPKSPTSTPPKSPTSSPPTSKRGLFSRFLPRHSKQKPPCIDSCSKTEKPPCSTKDSSPCASYSEANLKSPHRSPRTSPPQSPDTSPKGSKTSLSHKTPKSTKKKPSCKDSCSKLEKPPCTSSPCVSFPQETSKSPPRSRRASPPHSRHRTKFSSSNSGKKPPCIKSCSKEKTPPCSTKDWSPCGPDSEGNPPSSPRKNRRTKSSPPRSPQKPTPQTNSCACSPPQSTTHLCGCSSQKSCGLPQCLSSKKKESAKEDFPWPLKNQSPNNSGLNLKQPPRNKFCDTSKHVAKKSNISTTKKESGDCDPQCPTKAKGKEKNKEQTEPLKPPIPPLPFCQPTSPKPRSQSKMSGLHLKKLPLPQNISNANKSGCNVIRLNSKENLTIRMKPQTPSTEEIREGCNIKVKDEDGQTLYERREYTMDTTRARKHLVPDMYRDSRINRVATSKADIMNEKNFESCQSKSNTSLSNIVEINLNLKFKQVDKTTDINIKNCGDTPKDNQNQKGISQGSKDIYVLQDKINQSTDRIEDAEKRDVNIKIIIKSYQHNPNKSKTKINQPNLQAEFSRKISEKFHTVSTGYSDVLDQQTYSIHRATLNFTDSADASKDIIKPNEELVNEKLIEKDSINLTDHECVTKHSKQENSTSLLTANNFENVLDNNLSPTEKSQIQYSDTNLENKVNAFDEKTAAVISATDNKDALFSEVQHSNIKIPNIRNKEEKKKILKLIFEDSSTDTNTPKKSKMQNIRKMLRAVLTSDSSGYDDDSVNHELANELAYESLKPNFFKNSDSMKNYYQFDSSISDNRPSNNEIEEILYPTAINNSSDSAESRNEHEPCLCSHLAAKLNICENKNIKACCCRRNAKRDENIDCNLIEGVITKNIANYVDVETQDSNLKGKRKKYGVTIGSNTMVLEPDDIKNKKRRKFFNRIPKKWFSYSSSVQLCKLNRETVLGLSDEDKVIVLNTSDDSKSCEKDAPVKSNELNPIDILQLYETKRAVLEIYAEKKASDEDHLVAKLPKYIYNTESEIFNYENMFKDFHEFSARNFVMMSTTR